MRPRSSLSSPAATCGDMVMTLDNSVGKELRNPIKDPLCDRTNIETAGEAEDAIVAKKHAQGRERQKRWHERQKGEHENASKITFTYVFGSLFWTVLDHLSKFKSCTSICIIVHLKEK